MTMVACVMAGPAMIAESCQRTTANRDVLPSLPTVRDLACRRAACSLLWAVIGLPQRPGPRLLRTLGGLLKGIPTCNLTRAHFKIPFRAFTVLNAVYSPQCECAISRNAAPIRRESKCSRSQSYFNEMKRGSSRLKTQCWIIQILV